MKKVKITNKDKQNKINLTFKILKAVSLAGSIPLILLVPNLAKTIAPLIKGDKNHETIGRNRINTIINRLIKNGHLKRNRNGKIVLSNKGKERLTQYQLKNIKINKPKRWDKKWRLVAFDVWEDRRRARNILRRTLKQVGFVQLQASLWVYPYDCEEMIGLLRTDLKLSPAIQYMIVDKIDRDQKLREYFNLPLK